ncbi:MAG: hypothetical protein WD960_14615 [Gemmatimonadota bacterium]
MHASLRILSLFLTVALLSGCYVHTATDMETVRPGDSVRLVITDAAVERLREGSAQIVEEMQGSLISASEDSLTIERRIGQEFRGSSFQKVRQRITVSHTEVRAVQAPELHTARTALLSGGIAVVAVFLISELIDFHGGSPGSVDHGPSSNAPSVVPR